MFGKLHLVPVFMGQDDAKGGSEDGSEGLELENLYLNAAISVNSVKIRRTARNDSR